MTEGGPGAREISRTIETDYFKDPTQCIGRIRMIITVLFFGNTLHFLLAEMWFIIRQAYENLT